MRATQSLPPGYHSIGTVDIAKDQRLLVWLNLAGVIVLAASGWLFFRIMVWLRPQDAAKAFARLEISSITGAVSLLAWVLGLTAFHVILHEAIHGIFFWLFTCSRPRFALRWSYAYASAPDWYIPRDPFLITTLSPLVVITFLGLLIFRAAPTAWLLPAWYVISMNAAGTGGDAMVAAWLLRQPSTCLAQDRGDAVTLYVAGAGHQTSESSIL